MSLESLLIRNARCIADSNEVDIKPITVLLGQNSSGKSTFLRTLALIRQSTATSGNSALQLFGDYVDFGTFDKYLRRGVNSLTLGFTLKFNARDAARRRSPMSQFYRDGYPINLKLIFSGDEFYNSITEIEIGMFEHTISIKLDSDKISFLSVNGFDFSDDYKDIMAASSIGIVPTLIADPENNNAKTVNYSRYKFITQVSADDKRVSFENIVDYYMSIHIDSKENMRAAILQFTSLPNVMKTKLRDRLRRGQNIDKFIAEYISSRVSDILRHLNSEIINISDSIRYVGPLRDISQRYFRASGGGSELDVKGQNLSSYISKLSLPERDHFDNWISERIGYTFSLKNEGAHFSFIAKDITNGEEFSFSDLGVGFSQIAPILVHIWDSSHRKGVGKTADTFTRDSTSRRYSNNSIILIEQPELHLHPKMQALVARLIAESYNSSKNSDFPTRYIIETHSEHFVNMLGILVGMKSLKNSDINIVLFNRESSVLSNIKQTKFTQLGQLKDWPIDFMDPGFI